MDSTYMPVSKICEQYGLSKRTVYRFFEEIEGTDRYKKAWVKLNECGTSLYSTLVLEDYLHYRTELQNRNLKKLLPPYDPEEVLWQRGGKQSSLIRRAAQVEQPQVDKDMIRKLMKEILLEGIGA